MEDIGNLAQASRVLRQAEHPQEEEGRRQDSPSQAGYTKSARDCTEDDGACPADATTEQASVCASGTC